MESPTQIFIKTPTGKPFQIEVVPLRTTVLALKLQITQRLLEHEPETHEPNQQILSFAGMMLEDARTLSDYNIKQDATVYVLQKAAPKDILHFDQCHFCRYQAIDPRVLPCGHSCCRNCIQLDSTLCPVLGCHTKVDGMDRENLPQNWIGSHFFDGKPEPKACKSCNHSQPPDQMLPWCEFCGGFTSNGNHNSSSSDDDFVTVPAPQAPTLRACPKHGYPVELYCLDDKTLMCETCRQKHHRLHRTQLALDYAQDIKNSFISTIGHLTEGKLSLEAEQISLKRSKDEKSEMVEKFLQDIEKIDTRMKTVDEGLEKSRIGTLALKKSVQELPDCDVFDSNKMKLMTSRVNQTLKLLRLNGFGRECRMVTQKLICLDAHNKLDRLVGLLFEYPLPTIIFVKHRCTAQELNERLSQCFGKDLIRFLHADMPTHQREEIFKGFENGTVRIIIGTAAAARCADRLGSVYHVIHYELPLTLVDYQDSLGYARGPNIESLATTFYDRGITDPRDHSLANHILKFIENEGQKVDEDTRYWVKSAVEADIEAMDRKKSPGRRQTFVATGESLPW